VPCAAGETLVGSIGQPSLQRPHLSGEIEGIATATLD
jgi:hypothetical protein|tara:strand:- start:454 stop:564 length:111 start_codon:yes stop_codon:yes gene_type:complete